MALAPAYRGRLAPSPTGALHLGNARTFLLAWLRARKAAGALVLRMEDLDGPRIRGGAAEEALEDLRWLGLDWDEGPEMGGAFGPYTQSECAARYDEAVRRLVAGGLAYPCICSRREVQQAASAPHGPDGPIYPGTCRGRFRGLSDPALEEARPAIRLRVDPERPDIALEDGVAGPQRFPAREIGDFVIAKRTGEAAYQLACAIDDHAMRITEVLRGDDLLPSTARQLLVYEALGLEPPVFCHVPLVRGSDGRRLAKRHGDTRIRSLREAGAPSERVVALLARWSGLDFAEPSLRPADLLDTFSLDRLPREDITFDAAAAAASLGVPSAVFA